MMIRYTEKFYSMKLNCDFIENLVSLNKTLTTEFESVSLNYSGFRKLSIDAECDHI